MTLDNHEPFALAEPVMVCVDCDTVETDPIFLDVETCSSCGNNLAAVDD